MISNSVSNEFKHSDIDMHDPMNKWQFITKPLVRKAADRNKITISFLEKYLYFSYPNHKHMEPAANTKKNTIGAILGLVAFAITYFAVQQIFFKPASFDKAMMDAASELNKSCPIMVDQETRLDNAVALPDNIFQYNYTLVNLDKSEVNQDTLKKYIEPGLINNMKTNPDLKVYRENKVTMAYYYKDKNGEFVLKLSITPDMYF
jgi:hypothetical protein